MFYFLIFKFIVPYAKTARILIMMSIPGQILFIYAADYIHMSSSTIGIPFVLSYLTVSLIQVNFKKSISITFTFIQKFQ